MPITTCDLTALRWAWEMKVVRAYLNGEATAAELIRFLQTSSDNIPIVECLLKLGGAG